MNLTGRKLLIIVTGGIAAYKINLLVRDFVKAGTEVKVVMTPDAKQFVTPLSLSTLSKNEVLSDFYGENGTWNNHVQLALWAEAILVAPCTANTLSKMVHGQCDNLALAVYMSAKCPVFIAPAMDLDMYAHPSTKQNLELAEDFGHIIIPAEHGELASGLHGQGRLADLSVIFNAVADSFKVGPSIFNGKTVLITAGPTYEAIDPVRFIGNHSSGKMGFALAEEAARQSAKVILISGPSALNVADDNIDLHRVTSAKEMFDKVFQFYNEADVAIASAAVADYAPKTVAEEKIKKNDDSLVLELVKNPDILKTMGQQKTRQFLVGFALETENEVENARGKLQKKNLDMIVLNSLRDAGAGFKSDTNRVKIISEGGIKDFGLKTKHAVAKDILDEIALHLENKTAKQAF